VTRWSTLSDRDRQDAADARERRRVAAIPSLLDIARAGLLWTGAQHEAMATPPHPTVARRCTANINPGDSDGR